MAIIFGATLFPFAGGGLPGTPWSVQAIRWCIVCDEHWLADAISNVLLFVPFGAAVVAALVAAVVPARAGRGGPAQQRMLTTGAAGLLLSLLVESAQWVGWPPGRSPAIADLLTNTIGALAGAMLATAWPQLVRPHRSMANALLLVWSAGAAGVLALTALALTEPGATPGDTRVRASGYGYAPAFGWYGGTIASLHVAERPVAYAPGSGPAVRIVEPVPWSVSASAALSTLDPATNIRAVLYLHATRDSLPVLLIGQQRGRAWLIVARRAARLGLYMPRLALDGAWSALLRDAAAHDRRPVTVRALASGERLRLEAMNADVATPSARAELLLTPALGWALLQPAVTVQSPAALLVLFAWLAVLAAPLGWWSAYASRSAAALGAVLVVSSAALVPVLFAVHPMRAVEWAILVGAYGGGVLMGRRRNSEKA